MNDPRSAFSDVTRCLRGCGATVAYPYPSAQTARATAARAGLQVEIPDRDVEKDDAEFTEHLLQSGWTRDGDSWVCPGHRDQPARATYRPGNHWSRQTIVEVGTQPADEQGRGPDDRLIANVDSAAPEWLTQWICTLLNGDLFAALQAEATRLREVYGLPGNDYPIDYVSGFEDAVGFLEDLRLRAGPVCDCGHEGLDEMFHLHPCPIAVRRHERRGRGLRRQRPIPELPRRINRGTNRAPDRELQACTLSPDVAAGLHRSDS